MFVYKYVFNGEVIYVGIAKKLENRLSQHGRKGDNIDENGWSDINKSKIFYIKVANEVMADVIESELIRLYKPKYNKAKKNKWCGLPFIEKELTWKEFKKISKTSSFEKELKRVISFHEDNTLKDIVKDFTSKNSICKFSYSINNFTEKELIFVKYILSDIDKKIYNIYICYYTNNCNDTSYKKRGKMKDRMKVAIIKKNLKAKEIMFKKNKKT